MSEGSGAAFCSTESGGDIWRGGITEDEEFYEGADEYHN